MLFDLVASDLETLMRAASCTISRGTASRAGFTAATKPLRYPIAEQTSKGNASVCAPPRSGTP